MAVCMGMLRQGRCEVTESLSAVPLEFFGRTDPAATDGLADHFAAAQKLERG